MTNKQKITNFEELVKAIERLGFKTEVSESNGDRYCIFAKTLPIEWGNDGYQIKEHNHLDKPYCSFCSRQCLEYGGEIEYISIYYGYNDPSPQKIYNVIHAIKQCEVEDE